MKFLFDFFPILLFFISYKMYGMYVATATVIAASCVQVGVSLLRHRRVEKMHLITAALVVLMGGASLMLHNEMIFKWKPTIVYWLFSAVFLGSQFIGKKPVVERMMGATITLPVPLWRRLNLAWTLFFAALGVVNLYVAYNFDTDTWADFKLFGLMGLMFAFVIIQAFFLARHMNPEEETEGEG